MILPFYLVNTHSGLIHVISAISREITLTLTSFSLKITKNGKNCHSRISHFTQMVIGKSRSSSIHRNFSHDDDLLLMYTQCELTKTFSSENKFLKFPHCALIYYIQYIAENNQEKRSIPNIARPGILTIRSMVFI